MEKSLKVIFIYIIYCLLNEVLGYYFHEIQFQYTFVVFAVFTIVEFTCFSLFYYYAFPLRSAKTKILIVLALFIAFSFIDFFLVNKMNSFDSIAVGVESIIIILFCIGYLVVQLRGSDNLFVYSTSNFWIVITFLIYLSGTFFLYIMAENMIMSRSFLIQYTIINSVFNILKNILLSIAMLMKDSPPDIPVRKNKDWDDLLALKFKN